MGITVAGIPFVHRAGIPVDLVPRFGIDWVSTPRRDEPIVFDHRTGETDVDGFEPLFDAFPGHRYFRDREGRVVFASDWRDGRPYHLLTEVTPGRVFESRFRETPRGAVPFWARERIAFTISVARRHSGIVVHGCGFTLPGEVGILCPGVSGAGKSTLASLLQASGRDLRVLSDDRLAIMGDSAPFRMWGTPWPGDANIADSSSAPLRAIVFLGRAPSPAIRRLSRVEALQRLMVTVTMPLWDESALEASLTLLDKVIADLPFFEYSYPVALSSAHWLIDHLPDGKALG